MKSINPGQNDVFHLLYSVLNSVLHIKLLSNSKYVAIVKNNIELTYLVAFVQNKHHVHSFVAF